MPTILLEHIRHDPSRGDRIDGNTFGSRIRGERAREAFDGGFGPGVQGVILHAGHGGRDGGGEHDAAALGEVREGVLGDEELGAAVEVEDAVEVAFGDGGGVDEGFDARIRDDDVQAAEVRDRLVEEFGHGGRFGDVGFDGDGAGVVGFVQGRYELVGCGGGFAVVDRDGGAAGGELVRDAGA